MSNPNSRILTITNSCEDASSLLSCLAPNGWTTRCVSNCRDALAYLSQNAPCLVLCESKLSDGSWRTIADALLAMKNAPLLMVIPSRGDETLVTDALSLEGYQVQLKTFNAVEVEHPIRAAPLGAELSVS